MFTNAILTSSRFRRLRYHCRAPVTPSLPFRFAIRLDGKSRGLPELENGKQFCRLGI